MLFLLLISFILYYYFFIAKTIFNLVQANTYSYCVEAVNLAVLSSIDKDFDYNDVVQIEKNSAGEIIFISTNSTKVNYINRSIAKTSKDLLSARLSGGIDIPFLALTGIGFISGYGNCVKLKIANVSSVSCDFVSDFKSVGINQTLHSLYIEVNAKVVLSLPFYRKAESCITKVCVNESVIIGKIPDVYLNGTIKI